MESGLHLRSMDADPTDSVTVDTIFIKNSYYSEEVLNADKCMVSMWKQNVDSIPEQIFGLLTFLRSANTP